MTRPRLLPVWLIATAILLLPTVAPAQQRTLTIDHIYAPESRVDFSGRLPTGLRWISDTHYLLRERSPTSDPTRVVAVDAGTGNVETYLDLDEFERGLAEMPGMSPDAARRAARGGGYVWDPDHTGLVVSISNDLYYVSQSPLDGGLVRRLTQDPAVETMPTFSPDGTMVAFVRDHDLVVVDVARRREWALTSGGGPDLLNGELDWVYQEEIYGRGDFKGFWWSPDSTRLAYLQTDESPVKEFTVVDHLPYRLGLEVTDYPKAGDSNPIVRLGVVPAVGGDTTWFDLNRYTPVDMLVVSVGWSRHGAHVVFQVQNREQTWLDLNLGDPVDGRTTLLLQETTPAWVDVHGTPTWLEDGSFVWLSERSGWKHLYHYEADGTLITQVTDGEWELRTLHGVNEEADGTPVYFSGTERSAIGSDVYRINLDGTGLARLSEAVGTHRARFSAGFSYYLDTWSDINTPPQLRVHAADGTETRVVEPNQVETLDDYRLAVPEFLQVTTRDGFLMEAMLIKPPDFDPSQQYPVLQHTYAGPHAQQVRNAWGGSAQMFYQLLAQHGIIVWIMDNRTASGKGAVSTWPVYQRFGELELQDIEDGVSWLKQQPFVDGSRIGIEGWSYGGFMTSYALTHSTSFAMGIAGGTVSDWRDYDTIYTERFMRTPQNNPDGYRASAPRFHAADLHGALLLLHGTMDDNVHLQNTLQFTYELQKAGKRFDLMLYPRSRHGVTDPDLNTHLRRGMLDFILEHLQPARAAVTGPTGQ
ncbi:MAG: S9 family peptidase [Vicinamibacterales bacterium]|nr:S9 family peptidase [Vicinamibacterales bacterium]